MITSDATSRAWNVLLILSKEIDRDAPLMQSLALIRIAMAGDAGKDQGKLADELEASSAAVSRTVQALGAIHYMKDREGHGLVERVFDAHDNRKRTLRLSPAGKRAIDKIHSAIEGKK